MGQLCNSGVVCAASEWDSAHDFKRINEGLADTHEELLHQLATYSEQASFALDLHAPLVASALIEPRLQRAIGVIYRPETERLSHYYQCDLAGQYDFLLFEDTTRPVTPLVTTEFPSREPETFPSGL